MTSPDSSPTLRFLSFSFAEPFAALQMQSSFTLSYSNNSGQPFSGKLVLDIYPWDQPEHPSRHFGYFAVTINLAPHETQQIEGWLSWHGEAAFSCSGQTLSIVDQWVGDFMEMGNYRVYARILSEDHSEATQAWLLQTLKSEDDCLAAQTNCLENFHLQKSNPLVKTQNLLIVTDKVPTPDQDSGSLRLSEILKILQELGWTCSLFPMDQQMPEPYTTTLRDSGVSVIASPFCHFMSFAQTHLEDFLKKSSDVFKVALLSRPEPASIALPLLRKFCPDTKIIYDTVDLHFLREAGWASATQSKEAAKRSDEYRQIELALCRQADVTITVTENEKQVLAAECPHKDIAVIPNIHHVTTTVAPFEARAGLLFIGSFLHSPNEDAMLYFIREIFPLVKTKIPEITFTVIGHPLTPALRAIKEPGVIFTGHVKDVEPYFQKARVFVCPLRYGAGLKGKIGMSMGYGLPIVTTSVGAEGFGIKNHMHGFLADETSLFVNATIEVYLDEKLWNKLSSHGRHLIVNNFSLEQATQQMESIMKAIQASQIKSGLGYD